MAKKKPVPAGRHAKKQGSSRMREFGYRKVEIWLDCDELPVVNRAARKDGKRLATWVREIALLHASHHTYKKP